MTFELTEFPLYVREGLDDKNTGTKITYGGWPPGPVFRFEDRIEEGVLVDVEDGDS